MRTRAAGQNNTHAVTESGGFQTYSSLIWYSNGVIFTLSGNTGSDDLLSIARSIK